MNDRTEKTETLGQTLSTAAPCQATGDFRGIIWAPLVELNHTRAFYWAGLTPCLHCSQ